MSPFHNKMLSTALSPFVQSVTILSLNVLYVACLILIVMSQQIFYCIKLSVNRGNREVILTFVCSSNLAVFLLLSPLPCHFSSLQIHAEVQDMGLYRGTCHFPAGLIKTILLAKSNSVQRQKVFTARANVISFFSPSPVRC